MKFTYPSGSRPLDGYTIKRGIGRGGFGEVYYAKSDGGKEVALKLIRRNIDIELRGVMQCLNLKHHNLLSLYDVKTDSQEDTWVIMEYVGGQSLEDALAAAPNGLDEQEVLAWLHGTVEGVAYLHDRGIVHRDLKPGNVFSDEGIVKIGDYGLSKFIAASRRSGQTESVGTVHYMAPEVANGRYGKEIDIYALGIMLYEMLTGHVPFEGESVGEVLMKHLTAQPDLSALDEPYRSVVARALDKDPERRIRTVKELLEGLPEPAEVKYRPAVQVSLPRERSERVEDFGAAAAAPESPVTAEIVDEPPVNGAPVNGAPAEDIDPVARSVRDNWRQAKQSWDRAELSGWQRVALLVLLGLVVFSSIEIWLPALVVGGLGYGGYRLFRGVSGNSNQLPPPNGPPPLPPGGGAASPGTGRQDAFEQAQQFAQQAGQFAQQAGQAAAAAATETAQTASRFQQRQSQRHSRREARRMHRQQADQALDNRGGQERVAELAGSMLLATLVSLAMCVLFGVFERIERPEQFAWVALVATAGSWSVLIPAKFWEGRRGDALSRRFVLLMGGLLVGLFAFFLHDALLVQLPADPDVSVTMLSDTGGLFTNVYGSPLFGTYLAYFGFLFAVLRWWDQADPRRRSRLAFMPILLCGLWAWLLGSLVEFTQPWGIMAAVTASVAIQVASPWRDRHTAYQQAA